VIAADGKNWNVRPEGNAVHEAGAGKQAQWRFAVSVPADAPFTRPYYTRPDEEQPYYDLVDARYRNLPLAPYPCPFMHGSPFARAFRNRAVVQSSERIPGIGTIQNPLLVGPAISVTLSPSAGAVPMGSKSFKFHCTVHSNVKGAAQGVLRLNLPPGWRSAPPNRRSPSRVTAKIRR